jgi:hypothetical protein
LRGESAAQFFLIGNPLIANQAEDLTVPECFSCVHKERTLHPHVFLYSGLHTPVNPFWAIFCRLQPREENQRQIAPCTIRSTHGKHTGFFGQGM